MAAIWAFARAEVRQRARGLLTVTLLVALVGAVVMTAASGARRTASSFERFSDATLARHARVQVDDPQLVEPVLSAIEDLDVVETSGRFAIHPVYPDPSTVAEGEFDLAILSAVDDRLFRDIERRHVVEGRQPDPGAAHEVTLNELAASQTGLGVGDRFEVHTFEPGAIEIVFSGQGFPGFNGPKIGFEVVGVTRGADELQGSNLQSGPMVQATQAFFDRYSAEIDGLGTGLALRLRNGEADIPVVRNAARSAAGPEAEVFVVGSSGEFADSVEDATSVLALALLAFTVVAGVAGALALGGALSRQVAGSAGYGATLEALGLTRAQRAAGLAAAPVVALGVGVAAAVAGSVAASPLVPIGLSRRVDLSAGDVQVDILVLVVGSLVTVMAGTGWALTSAWRQVRSIPAPVVDRPSTAVTVASRLGLGPVAVTGLRQAFERGRGSQAVPVRSAVTAAVLGISGVVATALVLTSLSALIANPERYGWSWSAEPDVEGTLETAQDLAGDDRVEAVGVSTNASVEIEGHEIQGMAIQTIKGELQGVVRAGRAPAGPAEVALGTRTAEALGVEIGDSVPAVSSAGSETVPLKVVGLAVFRPVDNPDPGDGALLTPEGFESVRRSEGFESVLVRYPEGADRSEYEALLGESYPVDFSVYSYPRVPGNVLNIDQTGGVIRALGAFFGLLGLAGVAHALATSIRRRRHDMAVLRALGMLPRQTRRVVAWQASSLAAAGLIIGMPLGIIAGRVTWELMIGDLGLIDHMTLPVVTLAVLAPLVLALVNIVAGGPARTAGRIRPSIALRAE